MSIFRRQRTRRDVVVQRAHDVLAPTLLEGDVLVRPSAQGLASAQRRALVGDRRGRRGHGSAGDRAAPEARAAGARNGRRLIRLGG